MHLLRRNNEQKYANAIVIYFLMVSSVFGFSKNPSTSDSAKVDTLQTLQQYDSIATSVSIDSAEVNLKSLLPNNTNVAPQGMELLPISIRKNKFVYFDTTQSYERIIVNNAFDMGEQLKFIIRYGPVVAGSATMTISDIINLNNFECYHIVSEARSSKFFSSFFKVQDRVESFMDKNGLYTWRFEKHLREGKYRADQLIEYDHIKRIAVTDKKDTMRIPPCVQDILTAFYYIRTLSLEVGNSVFIDSYADRKLYPLEIKVHYKQRIKIKAGTFDCIVVEPILRSDAIFKQRGRLTIWLTDDSRRIPVQMKSKVLIGSITAELEKMEGVLPIYEQVNLYGD